MSVVSRVRGECDGQVRGTEIVFGASVQLRHLHTGKLLALTKERAPSDARMMKVATIYYII